MPPTPLCFVIMPFGIKKDPYGGPDINFDIIYEKGIRPAIEAAEMEPIRADEERTGGIIHKPMYERLMLCDFSVADLTTANPNVLYELGVRHAVRPQTTLAIFDQRQKPPFDLNLLRCLPYDSSKLEDLADALEKRLKTVRDVQFEDEASDSPIFQLLTDYKAPDIAHLKTDVFRDRTRYAADVQKNLARARREGTPEAVEKVEKSLGAFDSVEAGVLVDLFLSYRAVKAWPQMLAFYEHVPQVIKNTKLMREQYGFALNRAGQKMEALDVLEDVVKEGGANPETSGLIGRVYKDLWAAAANDNHAATAAGYLNKAIAAYTEGFEADWRDAYPGINAITLLELRGDDASLAKKSDLLPVVRFAVNQKMKRGQPDYWDYATLVEISVLSNDSTEATQRAQDAFASVREKWEPETTANNLKLILKSRTTRGVDQPWLKQLVSDFEDASKS